MDRDRPFFLYVAFTAPHYPLHAREEYIERYDGTYSEGWDSLRVRRFERMKTLGVLPQNAVLPAKDPMCHDWKDDPEKDWQQRRMETFAAMVEQMDEGIGKIVGTLRKTGEADNTIVIFLSDNGASAEGSSGQYRRASRHTLVRPDDSVPHQGRKTCEGRRFS